MIRILVVDDDRMARKGLILMAPWAQFGMEVVGEASNGQAALDFLGQTPVDLVLTDLAMPFLTGIELMRTSAHRHPTVRFVVLSFHQEFPQVQEAFRLGAVDYIAKQDLEREQLERVLGRVRDRFLQTIPAVLPAAEEPNRRLKVNDVTVYFRTEEGPFPGGTTAEALDQDIWLDTAQDGVLPKVSGWEPVTVTGVLHEPVSRVHAVLSQYYQRSWLYDRDLPSGPRALPDLVASTSPPDDTAVEDLRSRFLDLDWIADDQTAQALVEDVRRARLAPRHLFSLLAVVQELWIRIYGHNGADSLRPVEVLGSWNDVAQWISGFRANIRDDFASPKFAPHVQTAVLKAVRIIHRDFDRPLVLEEVARRVNMSRSHFSECFRGVTGKTFLEYHRSVRMEKARDLLLTRDLPVYQIGELVGYQDEKYFSRQFRDFFGLSPTECRRQASKG